MSDSLPNCQLCSDITNTWITHFMDVWCFTKKRKVFLFLRGLLKPSEDTSEHIQSAMTLPGPPGWKEFKDLAQRAAGSLCVFVRTDETFKTGSRMPSRTRNKSWRFLLELPGSPCGCPPQRNSVLWQMISLTDTLSGIRTINGIFLVLQFLQDWLFSLLSLQDAKNTRLFLWGENTKQIKSQIS